jgi:hypothetical protein
MPDAEVPFTLKIMEDIYTPKISQAEWELKAEIEKTKKRVAEYEAARLGLEASVRALEYRLRLLDDRDNPGSRS